MLDDNDVPMVDEDGVPVQATIVTTDETTRCETYDTSDFPTGKEGQVTEFSW